MATVMAMENETQHEGNGHIFFNDVLSYLSVGKAMFIELKRNLFTAEDDYANVLCQRSTAFIDGLSIISRNSLLPRDVADDICQVIVELQRMHDIIHERVEGSHDENSSYTCGYEDGSTIRRRGRPKFLIPERQLAGLRSLNFTWKAISEMLGVSEKTVRRRRIESFLPECENNYSNITDEELDSNISSVLATSPNSGERMVTGALVSRNVRVQRVRIRASINRVDPINRQLRRHTSIHRRVYSVPTPNALWHLDGNHKLIRWRMVIHGCVDGFSRAIVFLKCSNNNEAATVLEAFQTGVNTFHYPRRIRTDHGTENVAVARFMLQKYGVASNPVITGRSIHNQRIERMWKDVFAYVLQYFYNLFYFMESHNILDLNDEVHLFALQYVYIPRVNRALDYFSVQWNNHPMSTEGNRSPLQTWTAGFYKFAESNYTVVRDVLDLEATNFVHYGIDDDGPRPQIETSNNVVVPRSTVQLSREETDALMNEVSPLREDNDNGANLYQRTVAFVNELFDNEMESS